MAAVKIAESDGVAVMEVINRGQLDLALRIALIVRNREKEKQANNG